MDIADVARAAGLSAVTVSKVENGRQIPIVVTVRALAEALKQPIWFLGCYELLPEDTLGQRIRKARLYHGLTKKEFADMLGVNEKTIRVWEADLCTLASSSMRSLVPYLACFKITS
jgi:transcriptional regulator with XRE-family HTH domain